MSWLVEHNDGGRADAGRKGQAGDCAARAAAIATGRPYEEICERINELAKLERPGTKRKRSNANTGVHKRTMQRLMAEYGFTWVPTMFIGSGCTVHLLPHELPSGRIVCNVSRHYVAVIDGVVHDTYDPTRGGTRCVYGYWTQSPEV